MKTVTRPAAPPARAHRPRVLRVLSVILVLLVLNQAFLAGRGQFVNHDFINVHGALGSLIFLLVLVQLVLAVVVTVRNRRCLPVLGISVGLVLLVPLQVGLGYMGQSTAEAAAWHLPNGVLIFGLTLLNAVAIRRTGSIDTFPAASRE